MSAASRRAPRRLTAEPIGRVISSTAKQLSRAFERKLAEAGGSQPVWLILVALEQQRWRTQQDLAGAVGIEGPTLTHHLDGLQRDGLIERTRDPDDRRAMRVELTAQGDRLFLRLAQAALVVRPAPAGRRERGRPGFPPARSGRLRENVADG